LPFFAYKGRNARGELMQGVLEAADSGAVADQLFGTGVTPLEITATTRKAAAAGEGDDRLWARLTRKKVTSLDVQLFSRQIHTLLKSGVPIMRGLAGLQESATNKSFGRVIQDLRESLDAGRELAKALGLDPAAVTIAKAPSGARQLAVVDSAPLVQRLALMMDHSDNVMAECIAREVAAATSRPRSFAGATDAVLKQLAAAHVDTNGATLVDSSGLSVDDRLTATTLAGVVQAGAGPDQPELRELLDLLPIAGGSGTLGDRFLGVSSLQGPAGWLRAKTGSLTAINSLVGVVTDRSGRVLTFAFVSNAAGNSGRNALDALATQLWSCGCT